MLQIILVSFLFYMGKKAFNASKKHKYKDDYEREYPLDADTYDGGHYHE